MLKRFYSKKSGFTLVEIIIAFAIFAIMASMIAQILELSVNARSSNTVYQRELAEQERLLTLIQKTSKDYTETKGTISFTLGDTTIDLPYDMLSAKSDAVNAAEGLNYFVSNVNYQASGEFSPTDTAGGGDPLAGTNTGSQASRMDTRITGTPGIGYVWIRSVVKDTFKYPEGSPYAVPAGCTRYYFRVSASSMDLSNKQTMANEDMAYAQYRLFFRDDVKLDAAASSVTFTDEKGNEYTKNVYQNLTIANVGYVKANVGSSSFKGLSSDNIGKGVDKNYNYYNVQQSGTNGVRIATPYESPDWQHKGVEFDANKFSNFYIDFVGTDVTLTTDSFGKNGIETIDGATHMGYKHTSCPVYKETYDSDGKPEYESTDSNNVNIYGAYLYERKYGGA